MSLFEFFRLPSLARFAVVCLGVASALHAEDLTTSDGKVYKNIRVTGETPEAVKVMHDGGISMVPKKIVASDFLADHELSPLPQSSVVSPNPTSALLASFKQSFVEFKTKDGRAFRSAEVIEVEPSGLKLLTGTGIQRVKFSDLPEKIKSALGYDAVKAAEFDATRQAQQQEELQRRAKEANAASIVETFRSDVRLSLLQNVGRGWICRAEVLDTDELSESRQRVISEIQRIMVFGLPMFGSMPSHMQESKRWTGRLYRVGNFKSTDAASSNSTIITAAHIDRSTAVRWLAKNGVGTDYGANGDVAITKVSGGVSTGSGFAITADGFLATAAHVIENADDIQVTVAGATKSAVTVAVDETRDLAILKIEEVTLTPLRIEPTSQVKVGADLFCVGYPLVDKLGVNAKLTKGQLNAQTGLKDDQSMFQMSVQIQPGNSGGPVCNSFGEVVGVVSRTGSTIAGAVGAGGAVPQNVNFAMKTDALLSLAASVPAITLATGVGFGKGSAEERVMASTYLITVTSK